MINRGKNTRSGNKRLYVALLIVLILVIGGIGLWQHHRHATTASKTPAPQPVTAKDGSKPTNQKSSSTATNTSDSQSRESSATAAASQPATPPTHPSGSFVSNHKPGQNGSPQEEGSVCNTSPGVTCTISFTKDGVTKSLPVKTTDSAGAAYWNSWTPASIGLTAGNWTVTATAGSGQQAVSTQDPVVLEISS